MTLGPYPALSLAEARRRALSIAASVANGADPAEEKKVERKAAARAPDVVRTVRTIADEFLKRHTDEKNGARWAAETKRILDRNILPAIGDKPAASCRQGRDSRHTRHDHPIAARRLPLTARSRSSRSCSRWALSRGYVDRDPCAGIAKPGDETKRDRVLSDDELARVWRAAEGMAYPFGSAIRLLILTAARRDEVGSMTFAEVDLPREGLDAPGRALQERRRACHSAVGRRALDPRRAYRASANAMASCSRRRARLQCPDGRRRRRRWTRRAALPIGACMTSDAPWPAVMAGLGIALPVVEKILNHTSGRFGGVAGVYQRHDFADEKRDALDKWAARVAVIVGEQANGLDLRPVRLTASLHGEGTRQDRGGAKGCRRSGCAQRGGGESGSA